MLIQESKLCRVTKAHGWNGLSPGPNNIGQMRRKGELPYYTGRTEATHGRKATFYLREILEELWGVRFDMTKIYNGYYIEVKNPEEEGFTYVAADGELSDVVSSASR